MTVAAQQDPGFRPVGADRAQQAAQEGPDLLAARALGRALGRAQHGRDEAALACSIARNANIPPSDDSRPPSKRATIDLPETGDSPGSNSVGSFMAGVALLKWRWSD
jgi:hypothetical protein